MEGLPALILWEKIMTTFISKQDLVKHRRHESAADQGKIVPDPNKEFIQIHEYLNNVDFVPRTMPLANQNATITIMEDSDPVIQMSVKGRTPTMRHITRTHRITLDWVVERRLYDRCIRIKYVPSKFQKGDILTKGSFVSELWKSLCRLANIVKPYSAKKTMGGIGFQGGDSNTPNTRGQTIYSIPVPKGMNRV